LGYRLYLDVCCLNRPFDNWQQERIRLEGEAILTIIDRFRLQQWQLISSEAVEVELEKLKDLDKREKVLSLLQFTAIQVNLNQEINDRSQELEKLGFGLYDSFHLACAEVAEADVLLTTDDRFFKRAVSYQSHLNVVVDNPVTWLMKVFQQKGETQDDTN